MPEVLPDSVASSGHWIRLAEQCGVDRVEAKPRRHQGSTALLAGQPIPEVAARACGACARPNILAPRRSSCVLGPESRVPVSNCGRTALASMTCQIQCRYGGWHDPCLPSTFQLPLPTPAGCEASQARDVIRSSSGTYTPLGSSDASDRRCGRARAGTATLRDLGAERHGIARPVAA